MDIAVIGMSGRFPGAPNVETFWANLCAGVESISRFSADDLRREGISPKVMEHPRFVNAGGALNDIELFDAEFFGYSPREAETIDPQHRIFLECAWESLEHAGVNPFGHSGLIGVFAGTGSSTYQDRLKSNSEMAALLGNFQLSIGNEKDHLATRVAYKLDLHGPAVGVQTTCSTSLVAVVLACQGLLAGQCDVALAGGVSIVVPQRTGYLYTEGGILSPDGHCRAFDIDAGGAVGGNGCGIVVLQRLEDALQNGNRIHAILRGAAINNDGLRKVGYTAPSVNGQAEVIARALAMAGVGPNEIGLIEAHGTGTVLGDPIEIAALSETFRRETSRRGYCALGSVKTNVGHLDTAAGVTGLIKAILAVESGRIPPTLHFREPNPALNLADSPFYVNTRLQDWPEPRWAGVSSFGIGGTNAHVVLGQGPPPPAAIRKPGRELQLLPLSARNRAALDVMTNNLAQSLERQPEIELADVAHTLQRRRAPLNYRRVLVSADCQEAVKRLKADLPATTVTGPSRSIIFLFPGQGSQCVQMAGRVYRAEPLFRGEFQKVAQLARTGLGFDLGEIVYPAEENLSHAKKSLGETAIAQVALFAVEYALARLWMHWGIQPAGFLGHSVGEYVAASLGGTFSMEDALFLVLERGKLMQQMPPGSMLAVPLQETALTPLLGHSLSLAAVNGPKQCVVSGSCDAVRGLEHLLAERGLSSKRLPASHAFHSEMMDPVLDPFTARLGAVKLREPAIPWVSNLHGHWITPGEATDPLYWVNHLRRTVRFQEGLQTVLE
ncbi:MAG: type I polyketide synthase, partial [Verrucomicrobia bacterium]|nr:type I polyketide synthase [Verrucomicrobiota bacterium]